MAGPFGAVSVFPADHGQGGLAPFPDPDRNTWYAADRTVLTEGFDTESMDGQRVAPLMGDYQDADVGVLRLRSMPNFWVHASCDHAVAARLLPAGPRKTIVRGYWLVDQFAREGDDYQLDRLLPFWQLTNEQDWDICKWQQKGVDSVGYEPGPLSRLENCMLEFHNLLRERIPEARLPSAPARFT